MGLSARALAGLGSAQGLWYINFNKKIQRKTRSVLFQTLAGQEHFELSLTFNCWDKCIVF